MFPPNIVAVVDKLDNVRNHGRYFSARCPFHDDRTNSLLIFPDGFRCLAASCKKHGSLRQLANHTFSQPGDKGRYGSRAHKTLVDWRRLPAPETFCLNANASLLQHPDQAIYLKKRGVDSLITRCMLGWWEDWYVFPVMDHLDNVTGFVLRADEVMQAYFPERYLLPAHQEPLLYCPNWARFRAASTVFVVFGVIDALALEVLGYPVVSSTHGWRVRPEMLRPLRKSWVIVPDKGEEREAKQLARGLGMLSRVGLLPYQSPRKDPADYLKEKSGPAVLRKQLSALLQEGY